jgi:hypothetical protein
MDGKDSYTNKNPHDGNTPITKIVISPKGKYLVTYNKENHSIVWWIDEGDKEREDIDNKRRFKLDFAHTLPLPDNSHSDGKRHIEKLDKVDKEVSSEHDEGAAHKDTLPLPDNSPSSTITIENAESDKNTINNVNNTSNKDVQINVSGGKRHIDIEKLDKVDEVSSEHDYEENKINIKHMCVSDDKKLAYIYVYNGQTYLGRYFIFLVI